MVGRRGRSGARGVRRETSLRSKAPTAVQPGRKRASGGIRVLFVCKSNAARSQMAEAFFARSTRKHSARSAGLRTARRGKVGHPVPWQVAEKMEEVGVSMAAYRRKQLNRGMVAEADRVIVLMTPGQIRALLPKYVAGSGKVTYWTDIKDPQNSAERTAARNRVRARVRALVRELG